MKFCMKCNESTTFFISWCLNYHNFLLIYLFKKLKLVCFLVVSFILFVFALKASFINYSLFFFHFFFPLYLNFSFLLFFWLYIIILFLSDFYNHIFLLFFSFNFSLCLYFSSSHIFLLALFDITVFVLFLRYHKSFKNISIEDLPFLIISSL